MKNYMYEKLKDHIGHSIVCVSYGDIDNPVDICIECEDCNCVLVSADDFDFEDEEYFIPNGTKVKFHNNRIGIIDGNNSEDVTEFEDINYYICPIEFTNKEYWSDHYVMLLREDFEIIED